MAVPEVLVSGNHARDRAMAARRREREDPAEPPRPDERSIREGQGRTMHAGGRRAAGTLADRCHEQDRSDRAAVPAHGPPRFPPRRHRQGARPRGRGEPRARPGVPGRRDPTLGRRHPRDLHGSQDLVRGRAWSARSRCTRPRSPSSSSSSAAGSAARSSTTCATCAGRRRGSRSAGSTTRSSPRWRPPRPRPRSRRRSTSSPRRRPKPTIAATWSAGRGRARRPGRSRQPTTPTAPADQEADARRRAEEPAEA